MGAAGVPGPGGPAGPGAPGPGSQPPGGSGKKGLLAAVGAVVALAVIGGGVFLLTSGGDDKKSDEAGDKPKSSASASQAPAGGGKGPSGAPSGAPDEATGDKPMVTGWQTQTRDEHHFRYDVPGKADKWQTFSPDQALAYNDDQGKPIVVMTGTSNYREGGCASTANPKAFGEAGKGQLATVGTTGGSKAGSLTENARNWAGNWGFAAYGGPGNKPKVKVGPAKPWKHNGIDGYTATAEVTIANRASKCVPATAVAHSIAQKLPDGTIHGWVIYADQGVPNALSKDQITKIMNTVRPTAP
ncbi:hypothetical protein AB0I22_19115 [Streptomyces sp. NPDC050610]|uniref:hypothetical protein n=1 Tax=Streptomyces sp. NPDC050610 TaxID=3157097 RepID=UPI003417FBEA